MQRQQCGLERIDDLVALRVVLKREAAEDAPEDDTALCYHVLGRVHSRWTPLPRTLKDYISSPKPNGYRSLHTTVPEPRGFLQRLLDARQEAAFGPRAISSAIG